MQAWENWQRQINQRSDCNLSRKSWHLRLLCLGELNGSSPYRYVSRIEAFNAAGFWHLLHSTKTYLLMAGPPYGHVTGYLLDYIYHKARIYFFRLYCLEFKQAEYWTAGPKGHFNHLHPVFQLERERLWTHLRGQAIHKRTGIPFSMELDWASDSVNITREYIRINLVLMKFLSGWAEGKSTSK